MIFEFPKAPMFYIDGVRAYKAGEWPGIKSCKFEATRKMIRPVTEGIIFNGIIVETYSLENEPPILPKRKILSQGPSKEYEFKPCCKMVKPETDKKNRIQSLKVLFPTPLERKGRPEKTHYFQYKESYIKELQEREKNLTSKLVVSEEMKLMGTVGFSKKMYDNLANNKLLGINISKGKYIYIFHFLSPPDAFSHNSFYKPSPQAESKPGKSAESYWRKKEQEKLNSIKMEQDMLKKDIDYVRTLNNWDKSALPSIK